MSNERLCIFCEHFYLDTGSPGYSEYTPGSDFTMDCNKHVWRFKIGDTEEHYRFCILAAKSCEKYVEKGDSAAAR